jgi:hypothetical protein
MGEKLFDAVCLKYTPGQVQQWPTVQSQVNTNSSKHLLALQLQKKITE